MTAHGSAGVSLLEYALRKKKKKRGRLIILLIVKGEN